MKKSEELEENFARFIEFGKLFDKSTRRYLVQYIHANIYNTPLPEFDSSNPYFKHLRSSLDQIFDDERLKSATSQSESITQQIVEDVLRWIRKTDRKVQEENPHYEEKQRFESWSSRPTFLWRETWDNLINYLKNEYEPRDLDVEFYSGKIKELIHTAPTNPREQEIADKNPQKSELDVVIDDLLAQWDGLLSAKLLKYELEKIDEERAIFCDLLYAKVEEFLKLISIVTPVAMESGRFWDMSRGLWKDVNFNVLDKYSTLLENEESIRQLTDMLGRMREAEIEMEEETFQNIIIKKEVD